MISSSALLRKDEGHDDTFETRNVSERLVVCGCRTWAQAYRTGACSRAGVRHLFARFGALNAAASLDALRDATVQYATRPFKLGCPCCARLSTDEATLLQATAAAQRSDLASARVDLQSWLTPRVADWALGPLSGLATILKNAELILSVRRGIVIASQRSGHERVLH
jgi:hypothetical protein